MNFLKLLSLLVLICLAQEGAGADEDLSKLVEFYIYRRNNRDKPHRLKVGDKDLLTRSRFKALNPTFVVVHGWKNMLASPSIQLPKRALLAKYDCNVIAVDWSKIASSILYYRVAGKVPRVGAYVADLLKFLHTEGNLDYSRTHLIGHSLGAQVCGFAGKSLAGVGLARITGLDPARPGFPPNDPTKRIAATDANFVDCIITNGGKLSFDNPICKANFYPNGGSKQPGCGWFDFTGKCSHSRAYMYFAESTAPNHRFHASKCPSKPDAAGTGCVPTGYLMGDPASRDMEGIYYVKTRDKPPFPWIEAIP